MNTYEDPKFTIVKFDVEDIITTSPIDPTDPDMEDRLPIA